MGTEQPRELKRLPKENERLRRAVSDLTLAKLILAEAAKRHEGSKSLPVAGLRIIANAKVFSYSTPVPPARQGLKQVIS